MFELTLVDPNTALCQEWQEAFADFSNVKIVNGYFEHIPAFDCMVSAANSFGLMDGGVDLAISKFFGWQLSKSVQAHIIECYFGEQPVGTSFIIETGHPKHPFLAHTPTMRVPMPINGTDHVYLAMKAMLEAVWRHNQQEETKLIQQVLCPGLGTVTGQVSPKEAARQMALAYTNFLKPPTSIDWRFAGKRQQEIKYGFGLGY